MKTTIIFILLSFMSFAQDISHQKTESEIRDILTSISLELVLEDISNDEFICEVHQSDEYMNSENPANILTELLNMEYESTVMRSNDNSIDILVITKDESEHHIKVYSENGHRNIKNFKYLLMSAHKWLENEGSMLVPNLVQRKSFLNIETTCK